MRFTVEHPVGQVGCDPELHGPSGLPAFARAAEAAGFDALSFTEHPAPSLRWLRGGGHATLDPVAALSFVAASTTRLRIMPFLLVLPYRNPLLAAKSIVSMDVLSGGRLVVGAGGGYLRSEFGALGVDFAERGALFDEALDVLRRVCTEEALHHEGRHFTARGVTMAPGPVQRPHPPVWIGGNGRTARRRVARAGQGWSPLMASPEVTATTRMAAPTTVDELAAGIRELHDLLAEAGPRPGDRGGAGACAAGSDLVVDPLVDLRPAVAERIAAEYPRVTGADREAATRLVTAVALVTLRSVRWTERGTDDSLLADIARTFAVLDVSRLGLDPIPDSTIAP